MSQVSYGTITIADLTDGTNSVVVILYKKGTEAPSSGPSASLTYDFETAQLTPQSSLNGWVQSISDLSDASEPIWVVSAIANSTASTYVIASNEWSVPKKLVEDGVGISKVESLYWLQTVELFNVTYSYTGTVPSNAPALPSAASYPKDTVVQVASKPTMASHTFNGWYKNNSLINSTTFTMPESDVTITGSWTAKTQYTVTYSYTGTVPSNAPAVPAQQTYYAGDTVTVESNPTLDGYNFSGWSRSGSFTINSNVTITGSWTSSSVPTYTVTYSYTNTKPSGASDPPAQQSYQAGATVTIASKPTADGYTFDGWKRNGTVVTGTFTMPSANVELSGTWNSSSPASDVTVASTSKTLTSASNSISFTGLSGEPTSFMIGAGGTLTTGASPWKTAMVVYDGTNVVGQTIRNTNNAQVTYDSASFSQTYSNGTLTVTGTGTQFQANITYYLKYTYGGTSDNIKTQLVAVGSGATSITFTGLEAEPEFYSCIFTSNFGSSSGYQRVIGIWQQGGDIYGLEMDSSAKYSSVHWSDTYNNGSLTITSSGTNAGGYFHSSGSATSNALYYKLTYVVHNANLNSLRSLPIETETKGKAEISEKNEEEEIILTKGVTLRSGSSSTTPAKPYYEPVSEDSAYVVTTAADITDAWTLAIPTYVRDGTYYTCLQIHYTNNMVDWSDPQLDQVLTDNSASALTAYESTTLLGGHFFYKSTDLSASTLGGANIVQFIENSSGQDVTDNPGQWGYNVHIGANGIQIRENEDVLSEWTTSALKFYNYGANYPTIRLTNNNSTKSLIFSNPNTNNSLMELVANNDNTSYLTFYDTSSSHNQLMKLDTNSLIFYKDGNNSAATLNSNGLSINDGTIKIGNFANASNGYVYLSTYNSTDQVINGITKTDWRLILGNTFGVTSTGYLTATEGKLGGKESYIELCKQEGQNASYYLNVRLSQLILKLGDLYYNQAEDKYLEEDLIEVNTFIDNQRDFIDLWQGITEYTYNNYTIKQYIDILDNTGNDIKYYYNTNEFSEETYQRSSDTSVNSDKTYFIYNSTVQEYVEVENPTGNPYQNNYYELISPEEDWEELTNVTENQLTSIKVGGLDQSFKFETDSFGQKQKLLIKSPREVNNTTIMIDPSFIELFAYNNEQSLDLTVGLENNYKYELTTDTTVVSGQVYYTLDSNGYIVVENPSGNPEDQNWYVLVIEEQQKPYLGINLNSGSIFSIREEDNYYFKTETGFKISNFGLFSYKNGLAIGIV